MVNYMTFQDWMLDKRVLKRNILNGTVSREDYQKYLEGLPDMQDHIAEEEEEDEDEEEEETEDTPVVEADDTSDSENEKSG